MFSARETPLGRLYTRLGLSQEQAAKRWGCWQSQMSKFARRGVPAWLLKAILADPQALEAMAELGIAISDLLSGVSSDEAA